MMFYMKLCLCSLAAVACGLNLRETTVRVCERHSGFNIPDLEIKCPAGQVINIESANYGRTKPDADICPYGKSHKNEQDCISDASEDLIIQQCDGKSTCKVAPTNAVFGDPCVGTYKYLEVTYYCDLAPLPGPGCPAPGECMKGRKCPKGWVSAGPPSERCSGRKMKCCIHYPTKRCDDVGGKCFGNNTCPDGWSSAGGKRDKCIGKDLKCCLQEPSTPPLCAAVSPDARCLKARKNCPPGWVSAGQPSGKCPGRNKKCCVYKPTKGCDDVGGTCFTAANGKCPDGWSSAGGKPGKCVGTDLKCCLQGSDAAGEDEDNMVTTEAGFTEE